LVGRPAKAKAIQTTSAYRFLSSTEAAEHFFLTTESAFHKSIRPKNFVFNSDILWEKMAKKISRESLVV
jgi:hypothetical protein